MKKAGFVLILCLYAFGSKPVYAEDAALSAAFSRMMVQPGNAEAAFRYARLAAAAGQARTAIAALERVLRLDPSLDNIRLELASLYLAAGSPDVAAIYAREALQAPSIPPDVAVRARDLLAQAEQASSRSQLNVSIFTGLRWDSNATQATALAAVPVYNPLIGAPVAVNPAVKAQGDASWMSSLQLAHRYDLGLQTDAAWESSFSFADQRFMRINHAYDFDAFQLETGPRIGLGDIGPAAISVRPFASVVYLAYGDAPYATLYGGGLSGRAIISSRTTVEVTASRRFGNYYNTTFRPLARDYTGYESTLLANAAFALTPRMTLVGEAYYYWGDARAKFYSRSGPGGSITLASDLTAGDRPLGVVARLGLRHLGYGEADPFIDPFSKRSDNIFEAGLSLTTPLTERLKLVAQYSYYQQDSSYAIYSFNDNSLSLGLRLDF